MFGRLFRGAVSADLPLAALVARHADIPGSACIPGCADRAGFMAGPSSTVYESNALTAKSGLQQVSGSNSAETSAIAAIAAR